MKCYTWNRDCIVKVPPCGSQFGEAVCPQTATWFWIFGVIALGAAWFGGKK